MKVELKGDGPVWGLVGKSDKILREGEGDVVFCETVADAMGEMKPVINSSSKLCLSLQDEETRKALAENYGLGKGGLYPLVTMFNGEKFGPVAELSIGGERLLSGDQGFDFGFGKGMLLPSSWDKFTLGNTVEGLQLVDYRGQVTLWADENGKITGVETGYKPAEFNLYAELGSRDGIMEMIEFITGVRDDFKFSNEMAMGVLCFPQEFPWVVNKKDIAVTCDILPRCHKFLLQENVLMFAFAHGESIKQCRGRLRQTLDSIRSLNPGICHRIDYYFNGFHFEDSRYRARLGWQS